jgi:hypothetical protein
MRELSYRSIPLGSTEYRFALPLSLEQLLATGPLRPPLRIVVTRVRSRGINRSSRDVNKFNNLERLC